MSMLVIEVHSEEVDHRSGTSKGTGKQWEMWEQEAWVRFNSAPFPEKMKLNLKDGNPVKRGIYTLDPAKVVKVGDFNALAIDDRKIQDALVIQSELKEQAK